MDWKSHSTFYKADIEIRFHDDWNVHLSSIKEFFDFLTKRLERVRFTDLFLYKYPVL